MVNYSEQQRDELFYALSDATRRAILERLAQGACNVSELPNPQRVTMAAISKHLRVLHESGLVTKERKGREIWCEANLRSLEPMYQVLEQLGQFWRTRLDALDQFLGADLDKEQTYEKQRSSRATKARHKKGN